MIGYVQVYTGNGKGKTTAALGLAIRAAGAGLRVFIAQFMKAGSYSEIRALKRFDDLIAVEQFGTGAFVTGKPSPVDLEAAGRGLQRVRTVLAAGEHDMVILEEGNVAAACGLFPLQALLDILDARPESVEIVITGRNAHPRIIERADLVTEMKEIKHYFHRGIAARVGIEK